MSGQHPQRAISTLRGKHDPSPASQMRQLRSQRLASSLRPPSSFPCPSSSFSLPSKCQSWSPLNREQETKSWPSGLTWQWDEPGSQSMDYNASSIIAGKDREPGECQRLVRTELEDGKRLLVNTDTWAASDRSLGEGWRKAFRGLWESTARAKQGAGGSELGKVHAPQQEAPQDIEEQVGAARAVSASSLPGACCSHRGLYLGIKLHEKVQATGMEEAGNARQRKGLGCGGGGPNRNPPPQQCSMARVLM